jgi:four helix bundle protein
MIEQRNIINNRTFAFAISVVHINRLLNDTKREFIISKQLLRSGTAVGALVREAENAESKADFIHKLGIAQKECAESIYWMDLLIATKYLADDEFYNIRGDAKEILNMLKRSIITAKKNLSNRKMNEKV